MRHLLLPCAWFTGVVAAAYGGTLGNPHLTANGIALNEQGRVETALWFAAAVTLECLIVWAVLRPRTYQRSWIRAFTALVVLSIFFVYFGVNAMHGPTALLFHIYWLVFVGAGLLALFLISAISDLLAWRRSRAA